MNERAPRPQEAAPSAGRPWAWLLPVLLAVLVYAPAPWGGLVWDDPILIENQLPAFVSWRDAIWPPANIDQWSDNYYRPALTLSYMADRALYGNDPAGWHLSNVLFHTAATFGLFVLLRRLLGARAGAVAGAVAGATIFAVHPIHTETVCWITGRSDVVAAMFLIPALHLFLHWRDRLSWPALTVGAACLAIAMLSKETAAAGLLLVPALLWLAPPAGAPAPRRAPLVWSGAGLALALGLLAVIALRRSAGMAAAGSGLTTVTASPWTAVQALAWYAVKAWWPWPQSIFVAAEALPGAALSGLVILALAAFGAWTLWRWQRRSDGLPLFGALWFAVACAPALAAALLGLAETPVAERQLYVPSAGLSLLIALAVAAAGARRPVALASLAVSLIYAAATLQRGLVWQDNERLWADAVAKAPGHGMPLNELAVVYATRGEVDRAFELWLEARTLSNSPENAGIVEANIGNVYLRRRDYARAREHLEAAVRHFWALPNAQQALGRVLALQAAQIPLGPQSAGVVLGLLERARVHFTAAIESRPRNAAPRLELAQLLARLADVYGALGDASAAVAANRAAREQIDRAVELDPALRERPEVQRLMSRP